MAALAVLLVAAASAPSALGCTKVWGGASSFFQLGATISTNAGVMAYDSQNSERGVAGFNVKPPSGQTYCVAVSDDPMSNAQNSVYGTLKLTTPLVVAGYGFFTGAPAAKGKVVKMTAADTLNAYVKAGFTWADINAATGGTSAGLAGMVTAVARAGASGTTLVIKKFWKKAGAGVTVTTATGLVDTAAFSGCTVSGKPFRATVTGKTGNGILYNPSGATVCKAAANGNTIVYSQRAICNECTEIAIKNANGIFILANSAAAAVNQSLPTRAPDQGSNWSSFDTYFISGAATPPIVSCAFSFALRNYQGAPNGPAAKKLFVYMATNIAALANKKTNGFEPLPNAAPYKGMLPYTANNIKP